MTNEFKGTRGSVAARTFSVVVSGYHLSVTSKLLAGAVDTLAENDVPESNINVLWVPGAWEIPLAAQTTLRVQKPDAVICLGCVIRGETSHDQHINTMISNELGRLGMESNVPVTFGVITSNTRDQAVQRAGGNVGNKGVEAAEAAIGMLRLIDGLKS